MPFGFDGLFWAIMGVGIDWMIAVTQWVAALPGAVGRVPAFGIGPLIAASLGIILLGLLRTPLRWSGVAMLLLAAVWAARAPQPDILISGDGRNIGVRGQDGRLHLMHAARRPEKGAGTPSCSGSGWRPMPTPESQLTPRSPQASHATTTAV